MHRLAVATGVLGLLGLSAGAHAQINGGQMYCLRVGSHEVSVRDKRRHGAEEAWLTANGVMDRCVARNAYLLARSSDPADVVARQAVAQCAPEIASEAQTLEALVDEQLAGPRRAPAASHSSPLVSAETAKALEQATARVAEARTYQCWNLIK